MTSTAPESLENVDAEIQRITEEISKLQREAETTMSPPPTKQFKVPQYSNLADLNNFEIPKGFQRAPVTCPYDPSRAQRLSALEQDLSQSLWLHNRQDVMALVHKIRSQPVCECVVVEDSFFPKPAHDKLLSHALAHLVPSLKINVQK
jgi:hypothetical protein